MDFVSSEKKECSEAIESDAILNGMRFCLEQKILLSKQRDLMALELYYQKFFFKIGRRFTCYYVLRNGVFLM